MDDPVSGLIGQEFLSPVDLRSIVNAVAPSDGIHHSLGIGSEPSLKQRLQTIRATRKCCKDRLEDRSAQSSKKASRKRTSLSWRSERAGAFLVEDEGDSVISTLGCAP